MYIDEFTNHDIAQLFGAIADLMEILGEDRFRVIAYRRAATAVTDAPTAITQLYQHQHLDRVEGLSKGMAEKIAELFVTGDIEYYSRLKERMPVGVRELLRVPHIGPRTAGRLYNEVGITGLADLRDAIDSGRLVQIKGIGARTVAGIREGIDAVADREERTLLLHAWQMGQALLTEIRQLPAVIDASWAGSLRRGQSTIGDLDIVVVSHDPIACAQQISGLTLLVKPQHHHQRVVARLQNGMTLEVQVASPATWGATLAMYTGNEAHRLWLQKQALHHGFTLQRDGLYRHGVIYDVPDEVQLYALLGMPWIPPELREYYIADVRSPQHLASLFTIADMQSDLHMHTTWSDGNGTIAQMAESARLRGYMHAAITDHGALIGVTNGLDSKRLRAQWLEIDTINAQYQAAGVNFHLLRGVEVDILVDGHLALPNGILHELDIVVASPHINLRQTPEIATQRLLKAIAHPAVDIIGHPRGRILGGRLGAPVDMERVILAAAHHGVALEVNSGPDRLDIDGELVQVALTAGAIISVNSDAHDVSNLAWIEQGVVTARRGGATPTHVINTWTLPQLTTYLARERRK
ncbi:MAG: helix-hairpin-helix domain-containing protein [Chloroflexales bacterium]|nr:helix-hairpin-helix domain-containing protein [Chloroflexales bacterium]